MPDEPNELHDDDSDEVQPDLGDEESAELPPNPEFERLMDEDLPVVEDPEPGVNPPDVENDHG